MCRRGDLQSGEQRRAARCSGEQEEDRMRAQAPLIYKRISECLFVLNTRLNTNVFPYHMSLLLIMYRLAGGQGAFLVAQW